MSKKERKISKNVNSTEAEYAKSIKDRSPKVFQREKIDFDLHIKKRDDLTDKQKSLNETIKDKNTKIVFIAGPAGCSKTYSAIQAGLELIDEKALSDLIYIRTIVESASKSLGSLPGEKNLKMEPFLIPLMDKLMEFLPKAEIDLLQKQERVQGMPVNYMRGSSLNAKYIMFDEAQNGTASEIITVLTRIGMFSKLIILGDPDQSDIGPKSGFMKLFDMFNDEQSREQGIHTFTFTRDDIVRSGVLRFIVERIENDKIRHSKTKDESMFPVK